MIGKSWISGNWGDKAARAHRYGRFVVMGDAKWTGIEVLKPPYGRKPNDANKRVWTDHYFVGAVLRTTTRP